MPPSIVVVHMNQSSYEKNGCSAQIATRSRPVSWRASFSAAVFAVEPSLVNFTMSAPAMISRNCSAHSSSIAAGRVKFVPSDSESRTASTTGG